MPGCDPDIRQRQSIWPSRPERPGSSIWAPAPANSPAAVLDRGLQVIAVEPLEAMLAELHRALPAAGAVAGAAEFIPLADSCVDAILVGQAFHWFDPARALPEMARVLRPGGTLTMLWNHDDETDPLVAAGAVRPRQSGPASGRQHRTGCGGGPGGAAGRFNGRRRR